MKVTEAQASAVVSRIQRDPEWFCREALGVSFWDKQAPIVDAYRDPKVNRIAWRSANACGKSYAAGAISIHSGLTRAPGYTVTTGASWTGVEKVLWGTIHRLYLGSRFPLGGEMLNTEWKLGPQWGVFGVSTDRAENFAGFRTEHGVFVVVDEASALTYELYEAILGLCASQGSKLLLIGNPLVPEGPFHDAFHQDGWACFHTSAEDAARTGINGLATKEWIKEREREWGADSPQFQARVLGEFPSQVAHQVIPLDWLTSLLIDKARRGEAGTRKMGVDVARFGDDRTVLLVRDDREVLAVEKHAKLDTMEVTGRTIDMMRRWRVDPENVWVDEGGLGAGVVDRLHEQEISVNPVNFGEGATDPTQFVNARAQMYWNARTILNPKYNKFRIDPRHASLAKELTWSRYSIDSKGRIKLESKDDIKKRHQRSPDEADAFVLSCAGESSGFAVEAA